MTHGLVYTTGLTSLALFYAWLAYTAAMWLRKQQHPGKQVRLVDVLSISRLWDCLACWLFMVGSGLLLAALAPFVAAAMT